MRCFVAVRAAEPIRRALGEEQQALRRVEADVKWVSHEALETFALG